MYPRSELCKHSLFVCLFVCLARFFSSSVTAALVFWPSFTNVFFILCKSILVEFVLNFEKCLYEYRKKSMESLSMGFLCVNTPVMLYRSKQSSTQSTARFFRIYFLGSRCEVLGKNEGG